MLPKKMCFEKNHISVCQQGFAVLAVLEVRAVRENLHFTYENKDFEQKSQL